MTLGSEDIQDSVDCRDGEWGVCTDVYVAVPKRGYRGPMEEGGGPEYSDMGNKRGV